MSDIITLDELVTDDFFKDLKLREEDSPATNQLKTVAYILKKTNYTTLKPLLPLFLSIKGKPYSIKDYFPFEPFFRTAMPKQTVLKTGRQLSKSSSLAAQGITISNGMPYFSTLFITPLFEQIRRFSQNYVGRFIDDSPVKGLMSGVTTTNNVLQRSFKNKSQMIFSFAYLDAERTRGVSADKNCLVTGTLVTLADGSTCPIERLLPNMRLLSADKNGVIVEDIVTEILDQGKQHVFEVKFSNGSIIQCTDDERFRKASNGEWIYLSDLVPETKQITNTTTLHHFKLIEKETSIGLFALNLCVSNEILVCITATITAVRYIGVKQVWDINTQKEHAFFANGVLCHNCIDEVQDVDISFLPIIHETMSASPYGICQYTGTPKTLDNTLEKLWIDSSMAEWVIKCPHGGCNHWNIPALEHDLLDMIGPYRDDISNKYPGLVCAKCRKTINPRPPTQGGTGRWVHRHKDLRWSFAGYHIPQVIMPMHYSNPEKWLLLLAKKEGKLNTPISTFYNEVLGESWDTGSKLITITDLKRAAVLPWPRLVDEAKKHIDNYLYRFVAVDWGGGGISQGKSDLKLQSYTTMAVCGLSPDGRVHVLYGYRSLTPHDHVKEARLVLGLMHQFRCSHVVHDYTGAGTVRETLLRQAGLPLNCILPIAYTGPAKTGLIVFKPATEDHPRDHYTMDRNRALNYCCQFIKSNVIQFFQYDYKGSDDPGLLHDFLTLIEDKKTTGAGRDSYKILRDPSGPDDFAQAVTMGSMMLFQMANRWPNLAMYEDIEISDEVYAATNPTKPAWLD